MLVEPLGPLALAEAEMVGRQDVKVRRQRVVIGRPHVGAELRMQHQQRPPATALAARACARRARRGSRCDAPCAAVAYTARRGARYAACLRCDRARARAAPLLRRTAALTRAVAQRLPAASNAQAEPGPRPGRSRSVPVRRGPPATERAGATARLYFGSVVHPLGDRCDRRTLRARAPAPRADRA